MSKFNLKDQYKLAEAQAEVAIDRAEVAIKRRDTLKAQLEDDERFWVMTDVDSEAFGEEETVGIVDEDFGGIIAYVREEHAEKFIENLKEMPLT